MPICFESVGTLQYHKKTGVLKIKICGAVNSAPKRKSVSADDRSAILQITYTCSLKKLTFEPGDYVYVKHLGMCSARRVIGERERAYLVVQLIFLYILYILYISTGGCCTYRIFLNVSTSTFLNVITGFKGQLLKRHQYLASLPLANNVQHSPSI